MRAETPLAISAGTRLGNYEIVSLIGEGAMGEVYRAHDPRLRRDVAIKVLHSSATAGGSKLRRFEQEAQAAGMLNHPNLLTIYELGVHDGSPFIVSELLEGESLRARLQRGPVPPAEALNMAGQVARGLAAAHAKGIVHRDLKPENLFITTEGRVKILDFGLAKLTDEATPESCTVSQMTNPGAIVGTFSYMSPEQATAGVIDARSDLFSLGSIIFEMLCGRRAFAGPSPTETLAAILTVDPLDEQPKEISAAVASVLRRCLAKSPAQRFASADDVGTALQSAQTGSAAPMHRAALLRRAAVVAIAVLALGAAATIGLRSQRAPSRQVASIAVLPLVDLSGGQRDPDFADGMTDELITHLAQIRALRVISPASMARYKNTRKSLKQIGDELNVRSIVSASVFRSGSHVRLNVQLADARTEQTLWANRYEGPMQDVVTLQNELARSIAEQIAVSMTPAEQRRLSRSIPIDPEVYDAYTKGRVFLAKETGEGLSRAMSYFQDAIDRDPTYAKAYAGLADAYNAMTFYGMLIPSDGCPRARQAALEAIRLDPELGEAHVPLAYVYSQYDWDWSRAEAEYRRALDLNPNFDGAHEFYAEHLAAQGHIDEAIAQVKKRVEIDPVSWSAHEEYGWILYLGHRYGAAVAEYKNALDLAPDSVSTLEGLADVYAAAGRNDEAVAAYDAWAAAAGISGESRTKLTRAYAQLGMRGYWAERLKMEQAETAETGDVWPFRMATYYALLGDRDNAFSWLDKAFQERSSRMTLLNVNPIFDGLRSDARFQALLAKVGLTHGVAGYKS